MEWEKEKMLVTSIFSFSRNVFFKCYFFEVVKRQDCVVKGYTHSITTFFTFGRNWVFYTFYVSAVDSL